MHRWRLRFEQFGPHRIARALRDGIVSVFGPLPLRRHATVPFDFRRRVSRWPRGHVFQTPPFCERDPAPGDVAHVVGIGDDVSPESFAPSGEPPVLEEAVHVDDREQRAHDPALRRAARTALATAHARLPITVPLFDRRLEPQLDQPQHVPVNDPPGHRLQQVRVRDRVEVFRQISIDHVGVAPADVPVHVLDRVHALRPGR